MSIQKAMVRDARRMRSRQPVSWVSRGLLLGCLALAAGCTATMRSYPDPEFGRDILSEAALRGISASLAVKASYQVNDEPNAAAAVDLRDRVIRLLTGKTGIDVVPPAPGLPVLIVGVEHRFDREAARKSGMVTGLSFGRVENRVRDQFDIQVALRATDAKAAARAGEMGIYPHAIVTALGRKQGHAGSGNYSDALDRVLEHALARFFADAARRLEGEAPIIFLPDRAEEPNAP